MSENKKDRLWVVEVTIIQRYQVSAPTAGDAALVPRQDPFFIDHIQTRITLQKHLNDDN